MIKLRATVSINNGLSRFFRFKVIIFYDKSDRNAVPSNAMEICDIWKFVCQGALD